MPSASTKVPGGIGVYFQPSQTLPGLIRVKSVVPDSPAIKLGLIEPGDVCLQIGGHSMEGKSMPEFASALRAACTAALQKGKRTDEVPGGQGDEKDVQRQIVFRRARSEERYAVLVDDAAPGSGFHSLLAGPLENDPAASGSRGDGDSRAGRAGCGDVDVAERGGDGQTSEPPWVSFDDQDEEEEERGEEEDEGEDMASLAAVPPQIVVREMMREGRADIVPAAAAAINAAAATVQTNA